jgi:hypothetical protein
MFKAFAPVFLGTVLLGTLLALPLAAQSPNETYPTETPPAQPQSAQEHHLEANETDLVDEPAGVGIGNCFSALDISTARGDGKRQKLGGDFSEFRRWWGSRCGIDRAGGLQSGLPGLSRPSRRSRAHT